jgi:Flp pilus assembly pilin Flp
VLKRLIAEEDGQTLAENGLMIAFLALVCVAILLVLGKKVRDLFVSTNTRVGSTS